MINDTIQKVTDTQVISEHGDARILLAIRNEETREKFKKALNDKDFEIKAVQNVWEVFEALIDYTFDIFIADSNLPGTTCDELVKYCRKRHPAMQTIILAHNPTIAEAVSTTKQGIFNYLEVPVDEKTITAQARMALIEKKDRLIRNLVPNLAINKNIFKFLPNLDVVKQIGTGSTGIVFQVKKSKANYALKILRSDLAPEMHQLQRGGQFLSEAKILSNIKHPNIVEIYDYGFSDNYMPYILMEFVKGQPLTKIIKNNSLEQKKRLNVFLQICKAIQFIHNNKVLHRDIKPGNIMVADDLTVKLTDFGLAHIIDTNSSSENQISGSPAYMSPEAFNENGSIDHHSDIFSLGILGYELFTGEKPFSGNNIPEIRHSICNTKPVAPSKISPEIHMEIEYVLHEMLAKKPKNRFDNLTNVISSIESLLSASKPLDTKKNKSLFDFFTGKSSNWA
jgi:tRNA A-37 threonylcarbamoyl transferase component Bud32/ActR/RegA family two-component response regulator